MNARNKSLHDKAITWVKENAKLLIETYASDETYLSVDKPLSFFMAGSPGAGKTEASLELVNILQELHIPTVRIDPDEIRLVVPYYTGCNTDAMKDASFLAVEKLYDYVLKHKKCAILDSTFTPYQKIEANIQRAVHRKRTIYIIYVYQEPLVAWRFAKEREKAEGRSIPRDFFIRTLFESKENVQKIKQKYGDAVKVYVIKKNFEKGQKEFFENVQKIDDIVDISYSINELRRHLR